MLALTIPFSISSANWPEQLASSSVSISAKLSIEANMAACWFSSNVDGADCCSFCWVELY